MCEPNFTTARIVSWGALGACTPESLKGHQKIKGKEERKEKEGKKGKKKAKKGTKMEKIER